MKKALYLGNDNISFSIGYFKNMPKRIVYVNVLDWDDDGMFVFFEVYFWKFGITLAWFK